MVKLSLEVLQLKGKKLKTEDSEEQEKKAAAAAGRSVFA